MATKAEIDSEIEAVTNFFKKHPDSIPTLMDRLSGKQDGEERKIQDLSTTHKQEDESTSLFDRMSSKELMELYQTDREKWQQVMDSVQSAGERKLAKLQGR